MTKILKSLIFLIAFSNMAIAQQAVAPTVPDEVKPVVVDPKNFDEKSIAV